MTGKVRPHVAAAACLLAMLVMSTPLPAQVPVRMTIPGTMFVLDKMATSGQVTVDDVPAGRRFRGGNGSMVVTAVLQMPASTLAEPQMIRLAVHFRTARPSGTDASLRSVKVLNGSAAVFSIETHLQGDYLARDSTTPSVVANAWVFGPRTVSARSVLRLEVAFPQSYEAGQIPQDEFVLAGVVVEFPRKLSDSVARVDTGDRLVPPPPGMRGGAAAVTTPGRAAGRGGPPSALSVPANQVIYALSNSNELLWYGHSGREDGTFRWAAAQAKTVGTGWDFKQVFSGGDGVIYAITAGGDLMWYRHDGRADGTFRWASGDGKKVNTGWNNFAHVFSGGGGVIYTVAKDGDLLWFRHDGYLDGSDRWTNREGSWVNGGWTYKQVFSGGNGVLYAVTTDNRLLWFRHDGRTDGSFKWTAPDGRAVGTGWNFKHIFSAGDGVIYAVTADNQLLWYRHDGHDDGSVRWAASEGRQVGIGWSVKDIFSGS